MSTYNLCQFIGRLGKDPDFSVTPQGKAVARFSLAIDQGKDQPAMWLNVTAWEKLAEIVEKYTFKGAQVFVAGRLQVRSYDDKNGGKKQAIDLIATTVQLLDRRDTGAAKERASEEYDPFE